MSLCIDCGCAFCCDGTLYSHAPLKEEDFPVLANQFDVLQEAKKNEVGKPVANFKQPCKLCVNDRCSVHEEKRPAICGDYQCKLVDKHGSGQVTTEAARTLVENVKKLRGRLRPKLETIAGVGSEVSFLELSLLAVSQLEEENAAERTPQSAATLLDIAMMRVLLAKNFDSRLTKHTWLADKALQAMENAAEQPVQPAAGPGK
jgi:hypothetical protein